MKDDTLKRTMKLHHLVIFGVAFLTPMIAYTIYGVIATSSHGVESGSICLTIIAMLFTALSYGHMAKAYPAAGSAYTYTRKAINSKLGVIAGWIVLLGYVFFPMAIWLIGASYFSAAVPAVPEWVWLVGFIVDVYKRQFLRWTSLLHQTGAQGSRPGRRLRGFSDPHLYGRL